MNTTTKTVAERLRESKGAKLSCRGDALAFALGRELKCPKDHDCKTCAAGLMDELADAIEAEQAGLGKWIEVIESDRDDYIEHVTTFACWQMQIANMLNIPLAERNDSGEVQAKIIAALKERTKTEQNGVDVDALLKLVDKLNIYTQCGKRNGNVSVPFSLMNKWADIIRNAVKGAKPQLPEGIEWPRFEDGELVEFGDKIQHDGEAKKVSKVSFYKTRTWIRVATETYYEDCEYLPNEPVKRPEPEVLDADGVPIKVGDTVWHEDEGECVVERIYRQNGDTLLDLDVCGAVWNTANVKPAEVTHRKPDTFKSVVEEMLTDFDSHDTIELDGYFARLRVLMGGE